MAKQTIRIPETHIYGINDHNPLNRAVLHENWSIKTEILVFLGIFYCFFNMLLWADSRSRKDGKRLIKRVVGLPGDTLAMRQNRLFINGQFIKYAPLPQESLDQIELGQHSSHVFFNEKLPGKQHAVMFSLSRPSLNTFEPVIIPEGRYLVMSPYS